MKKEDSFAFEIAMMVYGLENPIASGMTTCVFELNSSKIQAITVDPVKLAFMKKASLPGFKVLMELEDSFHYEMDKLIPLNDEEKENLLEKIDDFYSSLEGKSLTFANSSSEYSKINELFGEELGNGLLSVFSKYKQKRIYLDIHEEQFMKDSSGKIWCLDAVMDINIYNEIQETN